MLRYLLAIPEGGSSLGSQGTSEASREAAAVSDTPSHLSRPSSRAQLHMVRCCFPSALSAGMVLSKSYHDRHLDFPMNCKLAITSCEGLPGRMVHAD